MGDHSHLPVLNFRDKDSHTVDIDFGDKDNITPSEEHTPTETHPYWFAGRIGPDHLDIVLPPGYYRHNYQELAPTYRAVDNPHIVAPEPLSSRAGLDNGYDDEAEEEPEGGF